MLSLRQNIRKMFAFKFLANMFFISAVLVPYFTIWGKIEFYQITILQAVFAGSILFLEIPTGAVADYLSRKTSLLLAAFFNSSC